MPRNRSDILLDVVEIISPHINQINRNINKINIDIMNNDKFFIIFAELPSINKEDIDIKIFNNKITIKGEKKKEFESYDLSEIKNGIFERTINIPFCITKRDLVTTSFNNGLLKLQIQKENNEFIFDIKL